ncbi:hypothetical protein POM88_051621 [Heracleum sosnowskyi]|uniref:Uncharacterized protein n=1 Tax=Heracleum sosnowskyi TaxID=360622 RepID=A0AAD8M1F7_9APIA|nr:hypothetical protein POM88_051621 [Heracleum sosnowskyi]
MNKSYGISVWDQSQFSRSRVPEESDCIFDKFECCSSGNDQRSATGSYSNSFYVSSKLIHFDKLCSILLIGTFALDTLSTRRQVQTPSRPSRSLGNSISCVCQKRVERPGLDANENVFDLMTKLLHLEWHPSAIPISLAVANSLYMYYAQNMDPDKNVLHELIF